MEELKLDGDIDRRLRKATGFGQFQSAGLPDSLINDAVRETLWHCKGRTKQWWRATQEYGDRYEPEIVVALNDCPSVVALAIPDSKLPTVSISVGACIRLRQLMSMVVYDRDLFPARGAEGRVAPAELIDRSIDRRLPKTLLQPVDLSAGRAENDYLQLLLPVAPTSKRQALASALLHAARDFLVLHEMAHIIRHQERFLRSKTSGFFFDGAATHNDPFKTGDSWLPRILELEADLAAAPFSASTFGGLGAIPSAWKNWTEDPDEVFDLWIVALALLFSFFGAWNPRTSESHPLVGVRLLSIVSVVFDQATAASTSTRSVDTWSEDEWRKANRVVAALKRASEAWLTIGLPPEFASSLYIGTGELMKDFEVYRTKLIEFYAAKKALTRRRSR